MTLTDKREVELLPGISEAIVNANKALCDLARQNVPVFLSGEAGTEKVFAAKLVHALSPRAQRPMGKVSVTWKLPSDVGQRCRQCNGGTLVVNVQREFPADMQYTLLEMVHDKAFADPISGDLIEADIRVVVTTSLDLASMQRAGQLLPELAELIRRFHVHIPPIRQRPEDIPALVRYAVNRARDTGRTQASGADAQVLALFRQWHWPGNAEDLLIVTAEAALNCRTGQITLDDIPAEFLAQLPEDAVEQARQVRLPRGAAEARRPLPPPPAARQQAEPSWPAPSLQTPPAEPASEAPQSPAVEPALALVAEASSGASGVAAEELENQARKLQRLFTLARRLTAQSAILAEQMTGPVEGKTPDVTPPPTALESTWEISDALEGELDRGLDSIMALRRQLAVLNEREKKAIETARDLYKRLLLATQSDGTLREDAELMSETQELAGELKQIDTIIQRVSGRFPMLDLSEGPNPGETMAAEEARAISQAIERASSAGIRLPRFADERLKPASEGPTLTGLPGQRLRPVSEDPTLTGGLPFFGDSEDETKV
jgi:DNA-binding NtrC family response regulator